MGKKSREKNKAKEAESVTSSLRQHYEKVYGEELAEIILDCWESKSNQGDDPLSYKYQFSSPKGGLNASKMYQLLWAIVDTDWYLWELAQVVDPILRKYWKSKTGTSTSYPFDNALSLFLKVIEERDLQLKTGEKEEVVLSPRSLEKAIVEAEKVLSFSLTPRLKQKYKKETLKHLAKSVPLFEHLSLKPSAEWEDNLKATQPHHYLLMQTAANSKSEVIQRRHEAWTSALVDFLMLLKPLLHKLNNVNLGRSHQESQPILISRI